MSNYYPRHVSGLDMPILRRNNCTNTASGILALISSCTLHRLRADSSRLWERGYKMLGLCSCSSWGWACQGPKHVEDSNVTYMFMLKCALKLVEEIILYYDARSKKYQIFSWNLHSSELVCNAEQQCGLFCVWRWDQLYVPKCQHEIIVLCCVVIQKNVGFIHAMVEAQNHA